MLPDDAQLMVASGPKYVAAEIKYQIIMRLAERWGLQAFRDGVTPQEYCQKKFSELQPCREWNEVTKVVVTAFVMREHEVIKEFLLD